VCSGQLSARLQPLPRSLVMDRVVPVAVGRRSRLLGLAHLQRAEAGAGLLIPRCSSVHTFGMRFELDLVFLDPRGRALALQARVPPRRLVWCRGAAAVLELPARADVPAGAAASGAAPPRLPPSRFAA
jgi:uncharacterized membrane protein (UPF0127 family)